MCLIANFIFLYKTVFLRDFHLYFFIGLEAHVKVFTPTQKSFFIEPDSEYKKDRPKKQSKSAKIFYKKYKYVEE